MPQEIRSDVVTTYGLGISTWEVAEGTPSAIRSLKARIPTNKRRKPSKIEHPRHLRSKIEAWPTTNSLLKIDQFNALHHQWAYQLGLRLLSALHRVEIRLHDDLLPSRCSLSLSLFSCWWS